MGRGVTAGVIAGATGVGDRGGLWTIIVEVFELSEEQIGLSGMIEVYTVDPVSVNFEFNLEKGGTEGKLLFSFKSGDEFRISTVSEKNTINTRLKSSIKQTLSSDVFGSEIPLLKSFKLIFTTVLVNPNFSVSV